MNAAKPYKSCYLTNNLGFNHIMSVLAAWNNQRGNSARQVIMCLNLNNVTMW